MSMDNDGGFGGFYFEEGDRSTAYVYMTDPANVEAARAAFNKLYREGASEITVAPVQGKYTMEQLVEWFQMTDRALLEAGIGATSGGVESSENKFTLGLPTEDDLPAAEAILRELGVPRGAVEFGFGPSELLGNVSGVSPASRVYSRGASC